MESLVLSSAFLGMSIGTSLCCFWLACHESTLSRTESQSIIGLQDVFLGVASAAILCAGALGSVTVHTWRIATATAEFQKSTPKKHFYSAISKTKPLDSIPESEMEYLPYM